MNCGVVERGRSDAESAQNSTTRPDGDCPGGASQSARGGKGGGRADRAKFLPRLWLGAGLTLIMPISCARPRQGSNQIVKIFRLGFPIIRLRKNRVGNPVHTPV